MADVLGNALGRRQADSALRSGKEMKRTTCVKAVRREAPADDARRAGDVLHGLRAPRRSELRMALVDLSPAIRDVVNMVSSDAVIRNIASRWMRARFRVRMFDAP